MVAQDDRVGAVVRCEGRVFGSLDALDDEGQAAGCPADPREVRPAQSRVDIAEHLRGDGRGRVGGTVRVAVDGEGGVGGEGKSRGGVELDEERRK